MAIQGRYTEQLAREKLQRNGGSIKGSQITIKRAGTGVWGAIDYLCRVHGYSFYKETKNE